MVRRVVFIPPGKAVAPGACRKVSAILMGLNGWAWLEFFLCLFKSMHPFYAVWTIARIFIAILEASDEEGLKSRM